MTTNRATSVAEWTLRVHVESHYRRLGTVHSTVTWTGDETPDRDTLLALANGGSPPPFGGRVDYANDGTRRASVECFLD